MKCSASYLLLIVQSNSNILTPILRNKIFFIIMRKTRANGLRNRNSKQMIPCNGIYRLVELDKYLSWAIMTGCAAADSSFCASLNPALLSSPSPFCLQGGLGLPSTFWKERMTLLLTYDKSNWPASYLSKMMMLLLPAIVLREPRSRRLHIVHVNTTITFCLSLIYNSPIKLIQSRMTLAASLSQLTNLIIQ